MPNPNSSSSGLTQAQKMRIILPLLGVMFTHAGGVTSVLLHFVANIFKEQEELKISDFNDPHFLMGSGLAALLLFARAVDPSENNRGIFACMLLGVHYAALGGAMGIMSHGFYQIFQEAFAGHEPEEIFDFNNPMVLMGVAAGTACAVGAPLYNSFRSAGRAVENQPPVQGDVEQLQGHEGYRPD